MSGHSVCIVKSLAFRRHRARASSLQLVEKELGAKAVRDVAMVSARGEKMNAAKSLLLAKRLLPWSCLKDNSIRYGSMRAHGSRHGRPHPLDYQPKAIAL
jgi:hypothetical protein